jgi:hypothetical protein
MNIEEVFEKYNNEFLTFDKVENKKSKLADLHAFLLLDSIVTTANNIVGSAEHDVIWLDVDIDELAEKATEEQILELVRCGVRISEGSLAMFV